MKTYDATQLAESLTRLAEALNSKPISSKGLEVWFDVLKEFPTPMVLGLLNNWAKLHGKFPTPAEVWKVVNDLTVADRERATAQLKAQDRSPVMFERSDSGKRALREIRKILENPKRSPKAHWLHILETHKPQTVGHDYAKAALAGFKYRQREPGEDEMAA